MKPTLLITAAGLAAIVIGVTLSMTHAATPDKTTGINACSLLSTEEISRLFNGPVRRPRAETAEKGTACRFAIAGSNALNISLWPTSAKSFDEFKKTLADNGAALENVSGVGDACYYWTTESMFDPATIV